jgi:hypothetical protein
MGALRPWAVVTLVRLPQWEARRPGLGPSSIVTGDLSARSQTPVQPAPGWRGCSAFPRPLPRCAAPTQPGPADSSGFDLLDGATDAASTDSNRPGMAGMGGSVCFRRPAGRIDGATPVRAAACHGRSRRERDPPGRCVDGRGGRNHRPDPRWPAPRQNRIGIGR